jgi:hypothetical protein
LQEAVFFEKSHAGFEQIIYLVDIAHFFAYEPLSQNSTLSNRERNKKDPPTMKGLDAIDMDWSDFVLLAPCLSVALKQVQLTDGCKHRKMADYICKLHFL